MANVIDLIKTDHVKVSELFARYGAGQQRQGPVEDTLVAQIVSELKRHANAEEVAVYPKLKTDTRSHATMEHQQIKDAIAAVEAGDGDINSLMADLKAVVEHHVNEEETNALPELETSGEDLEELGRAFEEQKAAG